MEPIAELVQLGLTEKEARTYIAILELGSGTIKPIAERAGLKRTSLYYFIDRLVELGLVSQLTVGGRTRYQALPSSRLIDLQQERLQTLTHVLPEFMSVFNQIKDKPRMSYYEGPEQIKQLLWEEPQCHKEILGIWSGQDVTELVGSRELERIDKARRANGIHVRVIRHSEKDAAFAPFREQKGTNRELRYAPEGIDFSTALTIYDTGKVSFVTSKKEGFGILIESKEIFAMMTILFESLWQVSRP